MILEHRGQTGRVPKLRLRSTLGHPVRGGHPGERARILHGAVLTAEDGDIQLGDDVVVMENALIRGRAHHPVRIGDAVLVGPHTHINGATVEDEVFIATGASLFPGSVAGHGSELRINSVLHVNSRLAPGTAVPIGWIAAGDPATLFPPDRHDDLWAVQEGLDFPGTVYGVSRGTPMRTIMSRQAEFYGAHINDRPVSPQAP